MIVLIIGFLLSDCRVAVSSKLLLLFIVVACTPVWLVIVIRDDRLLPPVEVVVLRVVVPCVPIVGWTVKSVGTHVLPSLITNA